MEFYNVSGNDPDYTDNQKYWYISAEDLPEEIIGAVGFFPQDSFLENHEVDFEDQTLQISVHVDYDERLEGFTFALLVNGEGVDLANNSPRDIGCIIHAQHTIAAFDLFRRDAYAASYCVADFLEIISKNDTKQQALRKCEEVVLRRCVSEVQLFVRDGKLHGRMLIDHTRIDSRWHSIF